MPREMYTDGDYLSKNPTWDVEGSPWKARQILRMMRRNDLAPRSICEVGCGAGEILSRLQQNMDQECTFWGYEVSPQAFELCQTRANEKLHFDLGDILQENDAHFDLILLIDVIEHLEDYFGFLREIGPKSRYKILHIPLDLSVQRVLRGSPLIHARESVGHIHYFTKAIALKILDEVGYQVLDHFYTTWSIERPPKSVKGYVARVPRKLAFAVHADWTARIMGGFSLMLLATQARPPTESPSRGQP